MEEGIEIDVFQRTRVQLLTNKVGSSVASKT